jgi:anthranilate synthase/indole-3-glycerol phosphate synthase/phosphoribosylanthranilate isomerase
MATALLLCNVLLLAWSCQGFFPLAGSRRFLAASSGAHTASGSGSIGTTTALSATSPPTASQVLPPHVHRAAYPDDDYRHILGINDPAHVPSKLQEISANTLADVERSKKPIDTQGCGIDRSFYVSAEDYEAEIEEFDRQHGAPLHLGARIAQTYPQMAIAAEFKRASPSKGDINPNLDAVVQCTQYADVGAAVISVLTDYKYFKGTLADMKKVRLATQAALGKDKRPAILRKDFILDRYQVLEARAHGADTLLLIVAILGVNQLKDLMAYSRQFGMEPLVEVHTDREMEIALECGAKVIGVNNRNLHTFKLDLDTTERAIGIAQRKGVSWRLNGPTTPPDIMIAALSGITSADDVQQFRRAGVSCVLVGETLMKSADPRATIAELLADGDAGANKRVLVKTCGLTSAGDAELALQAGASMLGVIFAPGSPRVASVAQAQAIVDVARRYGERSAPLSMEKELAAMTADRLSPKLWYTRAADFLRKTTLRRPVVVGVFQDQSAEEINAIVAATGIDLVQLHGEEGPEVVDRVHAPCIKVLHVAPAAAVAAEAKASGGDVDRLRHDAERYAGRAVSLLLDSRVPGTRGGGTGATFDWTLASQLNGIPCLLAGGLTPDNVADAATTAGVVGVDVSSGIETAPGVKDPVKTKAFVSNARR